jgi:hypothetical protein
MRVEIVFFYKIEVRVQLWKVVTIQPVIYITRFGLASMQRESRKWRAEPIVFASVLVSIPHIFSCHYHPCETLYPITSSHPLPTHLTIHPSFKMSLKRKASFTALPPSPSVPAPSEWGMMIDGSTHLHSRTRKRFRDDRPSDQVIYRKCLASPLLHL